ncbi:hypothetical protein [Flavobacterium hydrophilum]|uniref:Uncharacterized protein n=1 Tax=Flavobacterium hydrophilum TaxID=2211445 RepID=A0A2V4C4V3_9FLAO|nr:hypothetical protein [Flavobacterium hydrophilum]PXY46376.1 hypothetical protein DMB68_04135 [Flavobacterium hydrophilum]
MNIENDSFLEYDKKNILTEQQKALGFVFDNLDLSKIAFCGGIADYLNLRQYYQMRVNDLDIMYENEEDLNPIKHKVDIKRYTSKFYRTKNGETLVYKFKIYGKEINVDNFPNDFSRLGLTQSPLLGKMVWHSSFDEMKKFHNNEIHLKTSEIAGINYQWKRLYKHSRKASLYNNVTFLEEKNLIHTIKKNIL